MKILFVLTYYTPHWTGLTEHARRLAEGLASKGYLVSVLTTQHDKKLASEETIQDVKIVRTPILFRLSRTLVSLSLLLRLFPSVVKTDTVIVYTPYAEVFFVALLAKLFGKRLILIHNGDLLLPKGIMNRCIEWVFDLVTHAAAMLADVIVAYTDDYAKHSRILSKHLKKVHAILPLFPQLQRNDQSKLKTKGSPTVGFAGRFVEEKGFDILIKAIPDVVKIYPKIQFLFAGETNMVYEHFFEQQKKALESVNEHVTILGLLSQEKMQSFYRSLDLFVLPSRSDCLAFVQVEAMLAGVPVVVTNIPGARVPVQKTGMGLLVESENPESLAHGIVEGIKNRNQYSKKGKVAEELFAYEKTLTEYESLLTP